MIRNTTLLLLCVCLINISRCHEKPSVIIVGAGASGLAAATKLLKNNFTDIKILEAENRIGGRVRSVHFGDAFVDLGAEWCMGKNLIYDLVKDLNYLQETKNPYLSIYYSTGQTIDPELYREVLKVQSEFETDDRTDATNRNLSHKEYFLNGYKTTLLEKYKNDSGKLKILKEFLPWIELNFLGAEGALNWDDISATDTFEEAEGDQNLSWNGHGFKTILEILIQNHTNNNQKLPIDDKLYLQKEVSEINWNCNSTEQVKVKCSDGTVFTADHVIVTPSAWVLQKSPSLFQPALPEEKRIAINDIGLGAVFKVVFHFPEKWWRDGDRNFSFVWSEEDKSKIVQEFADGPVEDGISWLTYFAAFLKANNNPKVWTAWFVGKMVPDIEKLSDATIKNGCMYVLKKCLRLTHNVTEPDQMIRSDWYNNPHFRGSYGYNSVKEMSSGKNVRKILANPLSSTDGKLLVLFAGEATNPIHFGSVHGAIETGYREAERLIHAHES